MCVRINLKERCLVNGKNGEIKRVDCFDTLAILHSYLHKYPKAAQQLLDDVFKGKKVITEMIDHFQK